MQTEMGFIALAISTALILIAAIRKISPETFVKASIAIALWLVYITVLSVKGVFNSTSFPPKVPLLLVLPAFLFIAYFFLGKSYRKMIVNTPASWPVYFQSFRIVVELLLHALAQNGKVPVASTFEGYNYDIAIGMTAPLIAWLVYSKDAPVTILKMWNIAGLVTLTVVVSIFISQAYFPQLWGLKESIVSKGFGLFPYTFLPGFLMPCAVFMHVFSLVKIKNAA